MVRCQVHEDDALINSLSVLDTLGKRVLRSGMYRVSRVRVKIIVSLRTVIPESGSMLVQDDAHIPGGPSSSGSDPL